MPNTPTYALPYPALSDAPNVPNNLQSLATAVETALGTAVNTATSSATATGAQVLGAASNGSNVGPNTTVVASGGVGWPTIISVTVTIPAGLSAARRIFAVGYSQLGVSIVGNVEVGLFQGADVFMQNGGDPRVTNPTTATSFGNMFWGAAGAGCATALPAAGSVTYALKAKNNAAGNWTSFGHSIAVILI